ncbi:hypothetical protein E2C01_004586 [Portunus trituberculatus]|uniref:Uncharacterized protein n=1 Tax=Portunus trituberculatus TaxID=210409 RepID=A0A5B7CSQ7_PORTR|nr:hypothetical protein [Portunus trituberculatus]
MVLYGMVVMVRYGGDGVAKKEGCNHLTLTILRRCTGSKEVVHAACFGAAKDVGVMSTVTSAANPSQQSRATHFLHVLCCPSSRNAPTTDLACVPSVDASTIERSPSASWDTTWPIRRTKGTHVYDVGSRNTGSRRDQYCCLVAVANDRLMCSKDPPPASSSHTTLSERSPVIKE